MTFPPACTPPAGRRCYTWSPAPGPSTTRPGTIPTTSSSPRAYGSIMFDISPTTLADLLGREQAMDIGIRPLCTPSVRVAGPAFTVLCPPADNLMLHAAIYRAEPGSVIVVQAGDLDYAMAGGNVCAVAQRRGISAFVIDGVIR